jgi:hypothetical protein
MGERQRMDRSTEMGSTREYYCQTVALSMGFFGIFFAFSSAQVRAYHHSTANTYSRNTYILMQIFT